MPYRLRQVSNSKNDHFASKTPGRRQQCPVQTYIAMVQTMHSCVMIPEGVPWGVHVRISNVYLGKTHWH